METHIAVGARVRQAREALGLTRKQAAERAHLSEARWRQIENGWQQKAKGLREPTRTTPETLAMVAKAVEIDPDELIGLAGDAVVYRHPVQHRAPGPPPAVRIRAADFTPRERELLNMFFEWARDMGREDERTQARQ